eukprot:2891532-Rhodomonas_salina.1
MPEGICLQLTSRYWIAKSQPKLSTFSARIVPVKWLFMTGFRGAGKTLEELESMRKNIHM